MDTDEVERLCAAISLIEPNRPVATMDAELQEIGQQKLALCLAGRLMVSKQVNRESFRAIFPKIWRTTQEVEIEVLWDNIFGFHFKNLVDRKRVMAGGPWSFDGSLLVLEELTDVGELSRLAFNLEVAIDKPLQRFLKVNMGRENKEVVMLLRYERLQEYCFVCGLIGHSIRECVHDVGSQPGGRGGFETGAKKGTLHANSSCMGGESTREVGLYGSVPCMVPHASLSSGPMMASISGGSTAVLRSGVIGDAEGSVGRQSVAKGQRWKRRARERVDFDTGMVHKDIGIKRPGEILLEIEGGKEKCRRVEAERDSTVGGCVGRRRGRRFLFEDAWADEEGYRLKSIFWRQRSRVAWLQDGDRNTRFFHSQTSKRKKNNVIEGLFSLDAYLSNLKCVYSWRSIMDNAIVGFECMHALERKRKGKMGFLGLKLDMAKTYNRALLGKQCWHLNKNPTSLAARVLRSCYFPSSSLLKASESPSGSFIWRSLLWGRELVAKGSRWWVGWGSNVLVYQDRWLPWLKSFKVYSLPVLGLSATVDRLKNYDGGWNLPLIRRTFFLVNVEAIMAIPSTSSCVVDSLLWHFSKDDEFSVKSAYHLTMSSPSLPSCFIWRASLEWLPSLANLASRGVRVKGLCSLCKVFLLLCMSLWRVWYRRNRAIHGQLLLPAGGILEWSSSFLDEFIAATTRPPSSPDLSKSVVVWSPLLVGVFKLNVDASVAENTGMVCNTP
ncbi:hypothetical protein ACOSQ3_014563 [Xanthoceras sorbifolium]